MRLSEQFVYLFIYFFIKIFCIKKHKLCLNISIRLKSITQHTSNFHITPKKHNKASRQLPHYARSTIKHTSNFHSDITPRSIKNKQLFVQRQLVKDAMNNFSLRYMLKKRQLVQDVMSNFCSDISMLKKKIVGTRCNK